jgi:excinuclease ABC subunit C
MTYIRDYLLSVKGKDEILQDIKERLNLRKIPMRIEAFDISNIHGSEAVGSMVTFEDNIPKKEWYRHFRIMTVEGIDDFAMIAEIVRRRYRRLLEENATMPDLIIVDGGKGHLNAAIKALSDLKIERGIDIIGIAKKNEGFSDRVYIPGKFNLILHRPISFKGSGMSPIGLQLPITGNSERSL